MKFIDKLKIKAQLKDCDYVVAKLAMIQKFSGAIINDELTKILDEFMANPCFENAVKLIDYDPDFIDFFNECKPNGYFTRNINFMNVRQ